ncbi:HAMP domain-containing protein [Actinokineospora globicatena]|uniref:HAMP domain-containing protein n=1 Tax=Actinokineospora globicatena TaxID=103729 RepID=UPI0025563E18|nr:HAMP domain-containing protein [Actinokineospora globicatena]
MRRLAAQLPEAGFPASARSLPTVVLVLFLLLAGATAVLLDADGGGRVPDAFLDSQRQIAQGTARSIGAGANQGLADLGAAARGVTGAVDPALDALARDRRWRGVAVLSGPSRSFTATRGEQVPVTAIPASVTAPTVTASTAPGGEVLLVAVVPLTDGRLLAATSAVRLPEPSSDPLLRQSFVLTTLSGTVVASTGPVSRKEVQGVDGSIADAGKAATTAPGTLLGPVAGDTQTTLAYARVAPSASPESLDLAVVAVADGPVVGGGSRGAGLIPAAALVLIALAGWYGVRRAITGPILRVRADLLALAAGKVGTRVRGSRTDEVSRVVAAARACREKISGGPATDSHARPRRTVTARKATAVVVVPVLLWAGGMLVLSRTGDVEIPPTIVASTRAQTAMATEALRRSVNDGLADLVAVAGTAKGADAVKSGLEGLKVAHTRYRSLYVVNAAGEAGDPVGRPPLRTTEPPAKSAGLRQQNHAGRVPVLFAEAPLGGRGGSLVAEFDVEHIGTLLSHVPGHARVVDPDYRTIVATDGYLAFEEVTAAGLRSGVERARGSGVVGDIAEGAYGTGIVAAAAVLGGEVGRLGWTVVTEKPATELALPVNKIRKHAQMVALLAALIALFGYGWLLFATLGPLRRVARDADQLVGGDLRSVIYPQRHDEVGTIASCLEICRQAAVDGRGRLGEVRRPHGAATDLTQVMRAIKDDPDDDLDRSGPIPIPDARRRTPARPGAGKGRA